MKLIDTIRLAMRNLINNASHFVLSLLSIVLLSVLVMTLANFCWTLNANIQQNDLTTLNENGLDINISTGNVSTSRNMTVEEQYNFADFVEELGIEGSYHADYDARKYLNYKGLDCTVLPYFGRFKPNSNFNIIEGEMWTKADEGQPHMWIDKEFADKCGIKLNDTVKFTDSGTEHEFVIKGITDAYYGYVDFKYLNIWFYSINLDSPNFKSYREIATLKNIVNKYNSGLEQPDKQNKIVVDGNFMESVADEIAVFVYIICALLIAVSIGVCLVTVVHTLQTNIEKNNNSLGLMKALGTKNRDMKSYILTQIIILILAGTVIAMLISCLISYFVLAKPMEILMGMVYTDIVALSSTTSFWFVLPIMNVVLLGGVVALSSIPMLRRYMKIDAIKIINEGNV